MENKDYILTQLFNTLPLKGKSMTRGLDGKKVIDGKSEVVLPRWRDTKNQNYHPSEPETTAPILAAVMDKNLVGVDFDVSDWFHIAVSLVGDKCSYIALSDKDPQDGHFIFTIPDDIVREELHLEDSADLTEGHYSKALEKLFGNGIKGKIDIQYGGKKLLYLASSGNITKTLVTPLDRTTKITPMPRELIYYIQSILYKHGLGERTITTYITDETGLYGDITEAFVSSSDMDEAFFEAVTPFKWRERLKPNSMPSNLNEKPHDYLYAFATKLGSDASVSPETFQKALIKINSLCSSPKNSTDLTREIVEPILTGSARIEDKPIWQYNENWRTQTLTITDRMTKATWSVYYDLSTNKYLWVNLSDERNNVLSAVDSANKIKAMDKSKYTKWQEKTSALTSIIDIRKPYGLIKWQYGPAFNLYKIPKPIQVFNDPAAWELFPEVEPEFFELLHNILGTDLKVQYWLRWMATRLKTRNFSKVVWMFDGIGGAGKTPLGQLMANMVGALEDPRILRTMSKDNAEDKYNDYLARAWVVIIDEVGEFYEKAKKTVAGMVKEVSGTEGMVEIRAMNTSWSQAQTYVTFVMTTNTTFRLFSEANQTRLFYAKTRKIVKADWVNRGLMDKWIKTEQFCLSLASYLAQNVEPLNSSEYSRVPSWVYENDSDWDDYNRLGGNPEAALLDIFMKGDVKALLDFLGVESWADVPHQAYKKVEWNYQEDKPGDYQSSIILAKRKGVENSIQAMVENKLNWKKFITQLKDQDRDQQGAYDSNNLLISRWNILPELVKTEALHIEDKAMKEKL